MAKNAVSQEYKDFIQAVSDGSPGNFYIFYGPERYLLEFYLTKLRAVLVPEGLDEFNYRRFEGKGLTVPKLIDAVDSLPVFSTRTFIEIHDYDIFSQPADITEKLLALLSDLPDYVCLVFSYDTVEFKPDKRLKAVKSLLSKASCVEFAHQEEKKVVRWILNHIKSHGKTMSVQDGEYMCMLTGGDMTTLNTEIEKLCTYVSGENITREDIDVCVSPTSQAVTYKLTNAISAAKFDEAADILSQLLDNNEPPHKILFSVSLVMRQLLWAKICLMENRPVKYYMDAFGIRFDFQARNLYTAAKRMSLAQCRENVLLCGNAALEMNGTSDYESAIKELVSKIALSGKAADF